MRGNTYRLFILALPFPSSESLDQKEEVAALLKSPICINLVTRRASAGHLVKVSFIFRNMTKETLSLPGLAYKDSRLYISPKAKLALYEQDPEGGNKKQIPPLLYRVIISEDIAPIVVEKNKEVKITANLNNLFDLKTKAFYSIHFEVEGYAPDAVDFYLEP